MFFLLIRPHYKSSWSEANYIGVNVMDTAKMIYPEKKIAELILGKMKKRNPETEWIITEPPGGLSVGSEAEAVVCRSPCPDEASQSPCARQVEDHGHALVLRPVAGVHRMQREWQEDLVR